MQNAEKCRQGRSITEINIIIFHKNYKPRKLEILVIENSHEGANLLIIFNEKVGPQQDASTANHQL